MSKLSPIESSIDVLRDAFAGLLLFGLLALAGCSDIDGNFGATSFDKFTSCVRDRIGDQDINAAIRESCLQKHEELSESYAGMNVTAKFIDSGVLQVEYRNPHDILITNIEIAFLSPIDLSDNCRIDTTKCKTVFASGRTWILPNELDVARVVPPGEFFIVNPLGDAV